MKAKRKSILKGVVACVLTVGVIAAAGGLIMHFRNTPTTEHTHTEEIIAAVEATCTETGLTEGKKCSVCGEVITVQKVVPAKGHTEETVAAVEATYTETGLTEGKKCSVCGEVIIAQEVVPMITSYALKVISADANMFIYRESVKVGETFGMGGQTLSVSDIKSTEQIAVTTKYDESTKIEVYKCTYVKDGNSAGLTANGDMILLDGKIYTSEKVDTLAALNPIFYIQADEDCVYMFKHANHTTHTVVTDEAIEATSTTDGKTAGSHCSVCGEIIVAQEVIPATGHTEETTNKQ